MKNEKLPSSIALIIAGFILIGLVCYQLQCYIGSTGPEDSNHNGLPFPEKVFLQLSGAGIPTAGDLATSIQYVSPTSIPFASPTKASPFIPPYLLEELRARNPNDNSIVATINTIGEIKDGKFIQIAADAGRGKASGKIEIYDAKGKEQRPGEKARFEGDKPAGDKEVDSCYQFSMQIRKFYKDAFSRNSIDGKGMKMISTVNFGNEFNNAFWDGVQVTYGRPGSSSPFNTFVLLDIAGHEVTHGVTQKDTNLNYYGQAGALNESLSDVFGALIVQYSKNQSAKQANWLVGEGIWKKEIKGRALRDMLKPGTAYDDPKVGKDPQPAHMKDYIKTKSDNGGVHYNSGIPNKAFATFARDVGGNAWKEPGQIWYKARTLAGKNPSFAQFAHHTIAAAKSLGYENDVAKLQKAWKAVGVTPSATAKDTDTPKLNPEDVPSIYF